MKNILAVLSGGAFLFMFMTSPSSAQTNAKDLVEKECSRCHGINKIKKANKNAAAWEKTLGNMIQKGANIKAGDKEAVLKYLNSLNK